MTVKPPTPDQLLDVADDLGLSLSDADVDEFREMIAETLASYYAPLDRMPDHLPKVTYPRTLGHRPGADEDPSRAWAIKASVRGAARGRLIGKRIVLKDNICLAGVPMMNGSTTLEGFVPEIDATVVTRILDQGGEIVGKAHCEEFCASGSSHNNPYGPIHNPHKAGYTTGGSSSGCAYLVAAGEVDMAIGGDQAGSIREPAAFSGICGMKPTYGLVPYTGVFPIELTLDHIGPMTATTADNALLLEVIAGADGLDPRQYAPLTAPYTEALSGGVESLRIGVLEEGFGQEKSEPDVDAKVHAAAQVLRELGATVEDVSIPMHSLSIALWVVVATEGSIATMMRGNGFGTNWRGLYLTSLLDRHAAWRSRIDEVNTGFKIRLVMAEYLARAYRGRYYAKAQNLSRKLKAAYDEAFERFDLLLLPTSAIKATRLPGPNASLSEAMAPGLDPVTNTAAFNLTGHPALSIPCAMSAGLPVGLQLVARYYDEATIYRASQAFEEATDWKSL